MSASESTTSTTLSTVVTRPQRSFAWIAICLYAPFAWVLLIDYPWNGYQWMWVKMLPVLPGFLIGIAFHPHDAAMFVAMGVATLAMLVAGTLLGRRGRLALCIVASVAFAVSAASSFFADVAFRA